MNEQMRQALEMIEQGIHALLQGGERVETRVLAQPAAETATMPAKEPEQPSVTLDDIRRVAGAAVQAKMVNELREAVAICGGTKLSDIPEEKYQEFMNIAQAWASVPA